MNKDNLIKTVDDLFKAYEDMHLNELWEKSDELMETIKKQCYSISLIDDEKEKEKKIIDLEGLIAIDLVINDIINHRLSREVE